MPFTPAHAAAVLPLVRWTTGRPGWTAAIVAGTMAPDLPYFVPRRILGLSPIPMDRESSHSLIALLTTTALLGIVAALIWDRIAEPVARDLLPRRVAGRLLPLEPRVSWRDLPAVYLCTMVGVASHDIWDAFTHASGPVVTRVPWLDSDVAGVPLWNVLQHLSTVTGLLILGIWAWRHLRRRPLRDVPRRVVWLPAAVGCAVAAATVTGVLAAWPYRESFNVAGWYGATRGGGALGLGLAVVCAVWWLRLGGRGEPVVDAGQHARADQIGRPADPD